MSCCAGSDYHVKAAEAESVLQDAELESAAIDTGNGVMRSDFVVPAMHCASCIRKLESGFSEVEGVTSVRANLSLKRLSVFWETGKVRPSGLVQRIKSLGFEPHPFDLGTLGRHDDAEGHALLVALGIAGFAAMNIMLLSISVWSGAEAETAQFFHLVSGLIAIPAVFYAGRPFYLSAWSALRVGRMNMDVPISLAIFLTLGLSSYESLTGGKHSYFEASVMLLFFLLIGRYLDHMMRRRARGAIEQLSTMNARGAMVIRADGTAVFHAADEIKPGMRLRVNAGQRIPVDCVLAAGPSEFDRSLVSGESAPVTLTKGDMIEAGAICLMSNSDLIAEKEASESFLVEVIELMQAAEKGRGTFVAIADRMARIYSPAVHLLALFTLVGWLLIDVSEWQNALYRAIAVLIITCPCALALAVPVVHVVAATRLFKAGILMKDGGALERLRETTRVIFDKTGTVTKVEPTVQPLTEVSFHYGSVEALASRSNHPLSKALADALSKHADPRLDVDDVKEYPGLGMGARINGEAVRLGKPSWVQEMVDYRDLEEPSEDVAYAYADPHTYVEFKASETLKTGALEAVSSLLKAKIGVELLSGDKSAKVDKIAETLGAITYHAECTPREKVARIEACAEKGERVLMVGDGLNDAAALSAGYVSIAPSSACDVGRLAADFVFTRDSLVAIPFAIKVAKQADRLVKENFVLCFLYNGIAIPLAVLGYVTPLVAALAMSASSIIVIANSLRLNLTKVPEDDTVQDVVRPRGKAWFSFFTNTRKEAIG